MYKYIPKVILPLKSWTASAEELISALSHDEFAIEIDIDIAIDH